MTEPLRPVSTDQHFYAEQNAKLDRVGALLAEQNELLRQVLTDRRPAPPDPEPDSGPQVVELREPEPAPTTARKTAPTARGAGRRPKAST